ncbi:type IV secretory system conjugative DNA transfer family protein [Alteromonas gilva]|uniref:Type IV secretory system conjugative DNA transfer family protein n=1 Tax=Alteromonas gilva TaxID=2987522 RepID=A0ABT5L4U3_9ALTE|nr:type IV secretory system conjugative DNA transfer family protein [Alteromonas gilva]MDC8832062.1 type IV secretory system conjugative DNA transfer family protein [Alteromonas gilva]
MAVTKTAPKAISQDSLLLSWSLEQDHPRQPIGFTFDSEKTEDTLSKRKLDPILLSAGGHVATIAPTGTGKGVSCIIPNLLNYSGQTLVVDPKGENYAVTAEFRRSLGHRIVKLDPFNVTQTGDGDSLNALDLIPVDKPGMASLPDECLSLARVLIELEGKDKFWDSSAQSLIAVMIGLTAIEHTDNRNLLSVTKGLGATSKSLFHKFSDFNQRTNSLFSALIAPLLSAPPNTLGSILTVARHQMSAFNHGAASQCIERSSFSLLDYIAGKPMTIYLILPPDKLHSHRKLLRLWISTFIKLALKRQGALPQPTLMMVDETAQLGTLDELAQAITLLRGYGVQLWTFWQDLDQLKHLYPDQWRTLLNNCKAIQAFGLPNRMACEQVTAITGKPAIADVLDLDRDEMLLQLAGDDAVVAQKPNYLADATFAGRFNPNPYHTEHNAKGFLPVNPQRIYVRKPTGELPPGVKALPEPSASLFATETEPAKKRTGGVLKRRLPTTTDIKDGQTDDASKNTPSDSGTK